MCTKLRRHRVNHHSDPEPRAGAPMSVWGRTARTNGVIHSRACVDELLLLRGYNLSLGSPPDRTYCATSCCPPGQPPPVGHRAIVYDQRVATDDDLVPLANDASAESFKQGGPIRAFELDSSWGSGGYYKSGGVQRRLFMFNESTGMWANTKWDEYVGWDVRISDMLYEHRLDGFYRREGD